MARPAPRDLEVVRSSHVTDHMLRITLGGAALATFPDHQESAYIKLIFPRGGAERPLMRTYTIRHQRPSEIDVDFVLHDQAGLASDWAINACPGDRILVGGPGPRKLINQQADWFLLAGDMSALPAISVNLALLPANARGHAVIEVTSEADIQQLDHPQGIELHWAVNPEPDPKGEFLPARVRALPWLPGQPAAWAACEFSSMQALRRYFKDERGIPRDSLYVSSYWMIGRSEDHHKAAKRRDREQAAESR